ncbi:hypothetical protein GCM10028799_53090 [Kribbella italica]
MRNAAGFRQRRNRFAGGERGWWTDRAADRVGGMRWRGNPEFVKLWVGLGVSAAGSAVTGVALPLVAVVGLGASAGEMGVLGRSGWCRIWCWGCRWGAGSIGGAGSG